MWFHGHTCHGSGAQQPLGAGGPRISQCRWRAVSSLQKVLLHSGAPELCANARRRCYHVTTAALSEGWD